jgi:pilus assembly protein Flp/PilA
VQHLLRQLLQALHRRRANEAGQGLAEYALILALVAVVAIGALLVLGPAVANILNDIANQFNNNPPAP